MYFLVCNMILSSLVVIPLSIKQICRRASTDIVNDKKMLPDTVWNFIGIGKWTTSVLYYKLTVSYWLVMSWLVMQNNCRQNWYYTAVKNSKINDSDLSGYIQVSFFLYTKIVKLIVPKLYFLSRRALNLQGKIDLSETMILCVFMT